MKLVAHLIASDVRRFRWLFLAWLLIEVTATTLSGIQPTYSATTRLFDLLGIVTNLLWLAEFLLLLVMVPLVVQADPLVGTDAFWMTRPIPWRALLAAKVLLLWVLIAAVPVVAEAAAMAAYHVPISAVVRVVAQNIVYQTLWLMALMAAAAVTPTLARYALVFAGLLIGIALLGAITALIETAFGTRAPLLFGFGLPEPGNPTASLLLLLLLTAAGFAMTAVQYATRSRARSVVVGVSAVIVAIYAAPQWRWSLFGEAPEAPTWAREQSALRLASDPSTVGADLPSDYSSGENALRLVRARVRVDALPPGWSASASVEDGQLRLSDGRRITSLGYYPSQILSVQDDARSRPLMCTLLDVDQLREERTEEEAVIVLTLMDDELTRLGQARGSYAGRFRVALTSHEVEAVLPLRPGAMHQRGAFRIMVDGLRREGVDGTSVSVHQSNAWSVFDHQDELNRSFYLRNPQRRQAVHGSPIHRNTETLTERLLPMVIHNDWQMGFSADAWQIYFGRRGRPDASDPVVDDNWLAGAELVVVRSASGGSVVRTLAIEDFSVPPTVRPASR